MKATKSFKGAIAMGLLVTMVLGAIVLGSLIGSITDDLVGLGNNATAWNVTGSTFTVVSLVPLFLIIFFVVTYVKEI